MGELIRIQKEALGYEGLGPAEYPVRKNNRCEYRMLADIDFLI